jgi:hypothetical protein
MSEVTPLETFRMASRGKLVEIPGFAPGEVYTVRLRQPNLLALVKMGKISNPLLAALLEAERRGVKAESGVTPEQIRFTADVWEVFCDAALVEPTYQELKDNGVELTQEQMAFIADFAQRGAVALTSFRVGTGHRESRDDGENMGSASE